MRCGTRVVRALARVGLCSGLATLLAAGVLWAGGPVKQASTDQTRNSDVVKNHRQIPWVNDGPSKAWEGRAAAPRRAGRPSMGLRASGASSPGIVICERNSYDLQHNDGTVRQVATLGGGYNVHFIWTHWDVLPDSLDRVDRFVNYNAYSSVTGLALGDCGTTMGAGGAGGDPLLNRAGFIGIEVGSDDNSHPVFHQRNEQNQDPTSDQIYSSFVADQGIPGFALFSDTEMPGSVDAEAIWPHGAIDRGGSATRTSGDDVFHVVSHTQGEPELLPFTEELFYWRRIGVAGVWEGPVVLDLMEGGSISHHVATDPTDENVAVVYASDDNGQQLLFVWYLESSDNGADWITAGVPIFPTPVGPIVNGGRQPVAQYIGGDGPQAWYECTGEYDSQGNLHVLWVEQAIADAGDDCRLMHWSSATYPTTKICSAIGWANAGNNPTRSLWLSSPQIGFGDGSTLCTDGPLNPGGAGATSNLDYLYVTFEQYGGPTSAEANDVSTDNYHNSEIYLAVSNDGGASWSDPVNLTNTQTPGCDGTVPGNECASEKDPSINLIVDDTLHLLYYLDTEAGESVFGQGAWTFGSVMYYRIPGGTDSEPLCPTLEPCLLPMLSDSDPDCEYRAALNPPGTVVEELSIINCGNATLTGSVAVAPPSATWLQVSTAGFSLPPGAVPGNYDIRPVTMDAGDVSITSEGLYSAQIEITHNDPDLPSPAVVPVDFFVFDEFYCPEYLTLHTDCLWLEVSNIERVGNQNTGAGGLSRLGSDSSWSVFDGSLIIGVPPNPDTLVYRTLYGGGNGYPGFRALGSLVVDTSAYGTFTGYASASAVQTTSDSTIGIDVEYVFPQDPDSCEFVLIKYRIYNNTESDLLDLIVGQAVDFDVMPGGDERGLQIEQQNTAHLWSDLNLIYQEGVDSAGHVIVGDNTATRYKAGITSLQCDPAPRAWSAPNDPWLSGRPSGGFEEGYLYQEMTKTGFELFPPSTEDDLHSVMVFDNDVDLAPGESQFFQVGLVSSNTGTDATNILTTTKKAWKYCFGWQDIVDVDTVNQGTPMSYPYRALGLHEDGLAGGCCGCVVEKVSGREALTINPGPDPCIGTIDFSGGQSCCYPYQATFRVTDLCGTYEDLCVVTIWFYEQCDCICSHACDFDGDTFLTALDLGTLIDVLFAGTPDIQDPACPGSRADFDCDCFATALDLSGLIDHLFAGKQGPCNHCTDSGYWCGCD